jgi:TRAP-type C4-dicarboxylate transport system permease large subunit
MNRFGSLSRLALLAGLAYLGFYVYGIVMGVFSPLEMVGFTIIAAICLAAFVIHSVRFRRALSDPRQHDAIMREAHVYRERRGF